MDTQRKLKVLFLDGSPASRSRVAKLLETIAEQFTAKGCVFDTLPLKDMQLPVNDPDFHTNPQDHPRKSVRELVEAVAAADIIVLGTPLYHGSYSGLLKSALDHLSDDAFAGKVIGLVSNASGPRNSFQAAQELVLVARTMKGDVSNFLVGTGREDFGTVDGAFQIIQPSILERIERFAAELTDHARA